MKQRYTVSRTCVMCGACAQACAVHAITMTRKGAVIDQSACVGCGACYDNCASEAIERESVEEKNEGGRS